MKKGLIADALWAILLGFGSVAMLCYSYRPQASSLYTSLGGMFWPRILLWGILLFSACLMGSAWLSRRSKRDTDQAEPGKYPKTAFFVFLACFGYFLLLDLIGFVLSTLFFLCAMLMILGIKKKTTVAVFSVTTVVIFWLVFIQFLHVPLPRGSGIFREISIILFRY